MNHPRASRTYAHLLPVAALVVVAISAAILLSPASSSAADAGANGSAQLDVEERALLRRMNTLRARKGMARLRFDQRLVNAANWMSADLARRNQRTLQHTDSRGRAVPRRLQAFRYNIRRYWVSENLGGGKPGGLAVAGQFQKSATHRANMMNRRYRAVGISRVHRAGSRYGWYWTVDFGSKVVSPVA